MPSPQSPAPQALGQKVLTNQPQALAALQIANSQSLIGALEQIRNSRVISLTYNEAANTGLAFQVIPALESILSDMGAVPRLDLFLRSTGGQAEVPWRIVSLLREFASENLGIIVSRFALSGACHIAIGGDELIMEALSSLGPVDPTRDHPLLPRDTSGKTIPTSVQDLKHCIQFVREQLGEAYPSQNLALIISELFKYVNPLSIGAIEQTYNLSRMMTRKILKTRKAALSEEQITKIVEALAGQYYSHSYPISRTEVENDLGLPVIRPDSALSGTIRAIEDQYLRLDRLVFNICTFLTEKSRRASRPSHAAGGARPGCARSARSAAAGRPPEIDDAPARFDFQ
jgi:Serine dehydrogenase proteinase